MTRKNRTNKRGKREKHEKHEKHENNVDSMWFTRPSVKKTRAKTTIRKKTRKKKPGIIVDIPFSKYKSKGTRATRGNIRFNYQEYINIINFFKRLNFKVGYSNDMIKLVSTSSQRRGVGWGVTRCWEEGTANEIKVLKMPFLSFEKQFNIVMINIQVKDGDHANVALINNINRTIEYFEPHGHRKNKNSEILGHKGIYIQKAKLLKDEFKKLLPEHSFLNVNEYNKKTSFQTLLDPDENSGFCVIWCLLFVHYRLLNPHVLLSRLMVHIHKTMTTTKLLKYAKYVEDVIKGKQ